MMTHLLRIEAVNLDQVLFDTDQLSVIRGGGLLALNGVKTLDGPPIELEQATPPAPPPPRGLWQRLLDRLGLGAPVPGAPAPARVQVSAEPISLGASVGLYEVALPEGEDPGLPDRYLAEVARRLNRDYPHHTFVADLVPIPTGDKGFQQAHREVLARNRWRQFQHGTLAVPAAGPGGRFNGPCEQDDLRPQAAEWDRGGDGTQPKALVSQSFADRFDYGVRRKTDFIRERIGVGTPGLAEELHASGLDQAEYARSFEEIATGFPDYRLANKLAVLYFDGNGFGAIQDACRSPEDLRDFDRDIQAKRDALLRRLLVGLSGDPHAWFPGAPGDARAKPRLRFELLLWGGDEVLFVVPAWQGLAALSAFYQASADWAWPREGQIAPLTHAGALIFCDHKTPIARMTDLARDMAERVKAWARQDGDANRNAFDYLTLESVDFPAEPLERYLAARYGLLAADRHPLTPAADGPGLIRTLAALRDDPHLPHGKLHEGAHALIVPLDAKAADWQKALADLDLALSADPDTAEVKKILYGHLENLFPGQVPAWRWLHLVELWDYLAPRSGIGTGTGRNGQGEAQ